VTQTRTLAGLAVDDSGESDDRPPLVLLHGLTFDRTMWRPALNELARIDPLRRALAFDLPGHGESASWESYDIEDVAQRIHNAVEEAGLKEPVVVGHSVAAIVASVYAGRFATRGVVNVDQPLQTGDFASFLRTIEPQLRGPAFPALWEQFAASMHAEVLPEAAQELVRSTSRPEQVVVLGYWRDVLERTASEIAEWTDATLASLRDRNVPYLIVSGSEPQDAYTAWLGQTIPQATITVFPGAGHFPHLAHPDRFAQCLLDTATWTTAASR
jgi:pimeloyl-ACP methyl ester carboxylesterase